ncbi:hypothetical protein F5H01DRAFT_366543 [Linnemannia elongata]|nr:hypothetical protein F5H01DRAFT_366543 [Linnemannia elongata]
MSTPPPNTRKVFKTNSSNNRSAGTLATRFASPYIELISLIEDLKMLTNRLSDLKSSHVLFGTGEDMVFHPIENVVKMINFMEDGLVWIRLALIVYKTAASVRNAVLETVEASLDRL